MESLMLEQEKKEEKIFVPIHEKVTLTVKEAAAYSGVGEKKIRELGNDPRYRIGLYIGKKLMIKRKEFEKLLTEKVHL